MERLTSFKAYDIRGRIPDELNVDLAYKIGRAYAAFINAKKVVIGHDIRLSSPEISEAVTASPFFCSRETWRIRCGGVTR